MRSNPIPLITVFLLVSFFSQAQGYDLFLKSGTVSPQKNITAERINQFNRTAARTTGKAFAIIQFEQLPSENDKQLLKQSGIELLDYIPNNAYTVTITGSLDASVLVQTKARAVIEPVPAQKMHSSISSGLFPAWAVKVQGTVDIWISFPKTFSYETVKKELQEKNIDIISVVYKDYNILSLRIAAQRVFELAALPFIEYVQPAPGEDKPLNEFTAYQHDGQKGTLLSAPLSVGGRDLKGSGIVIGIGDNSDPQPHPDFSGRLITRAATIYRGHGAHVAGIAGGAGIRDEIRVGFAPKATLITQSFSGILINAAAYVTDHNMLITNNSYGNIEECSYNGIYDLYSRILDQQAFSLPHLANVFAAGNSGSTTCPPYATGFKTVLGGYQSAKNVMTIGNADPVGVLYPTSSRGPVKDGRLKPEIVAVGSYVTSCGPYPTFPYYWDNTGTSMAAPAVAGGAALLYQRFQQLTGTTPRNVLIKGLLCNGADDWGKAGPDFKHGFGFVNLWRSLKILEDNHIDSATITTGNTNPLLITVPAGLSKLKVMLVWNDPASAVIASHTLVNDLDLEVEQQTPLTTFLPLILDTIVSNVDNVAIPGADHINNIEQVTINDPVAGNYIIKVKGTAVPQNSPQQYFVVYDYVPVDIKIVAPIGGDNFVPAEKVLIQWDSHGDDASTFKLEFSSNNGAAWTVLDAAIAANVRYWLTPDVGYIIPNIQTTEGLVRITKNATGASSTTFPFTILGQPVLTLAPDPDQCEGYIKVNWTAITGATDYEAMILQGDEMVAVGTTAGTSYTFSGLSKDSTYWVAVRARLNGIPGRRSLAIFRKPDSGDCNGTISDGDIKADAIISPSSSGRILTSTELGNSVPVTVRVKNLDNDPTVGDITVSYVLNAGIPVNMVIVNPAIPGGATASYTFPLINNINMSPAGSYQLQVSASIAGDPVPQNNSLTKTFKQLANPDITAIIYPAFFNDNFDAAPVQSYNRAQMGLTGLDRYDFVTSNDIGRIRTFINSGMAYSGNRALTLDAEIDNLGTVDSLTGTFSLSTFNSLADDIRLDFRYKNHGQGNNAANKVWVRGEDTENWIQAYDLSANQNEVDGTYKKSASIEISDILYNAIPSQSFSTSFQLRWGQYGTQMAADNDGAAGYSFDDIRLYKVTDDMQMVSIDAPAPAGCNLGANAQVTITVRNSRNTNVTNVPVRFRVDGGAYFPDELIPLILANSTAQFTFLLSTADLSAFGPHLIEARVAYGTDTYTENDTLSLTIVNSPITTVTTSNPHLQNFESGNGSWYTGGKNSSWEYGTPASNKINRAASGSKAWKTRVTGNYNDAEKSYLYSPCYNISTMTVPTLSFSVALDLEDCGASFACDGAYVEYSSNGTTWTRLGASGQGTNWYNRGYAGNNMWSIQDYHRWHVATIPLPTGISQLRLRFVVASDQTVNRDGIAIDDIHIYDNIYGIYTGASPSPVVNQPAVNGSAWIDFLSPPVTGQLIASINPNGPAQDLGSTDAQAYIFGGAVRNYSSQYYHNRNITIKPTTVNLADSASVRFYFLDTETEALINATGCPGCYKPTMAYELGVSKYSDPDDFFEDGMVENSLVTGGWTFINNAKLKIVPFDKGYYAEFKVKDFSEFWLNNGGFDNNHPLPVQLVNFTAKKKNGKDVLAEWVTASENNVNRYEIEVSKGNAAYQLNQFVKIGEVTSQGNSTQEQRYSFMDIEFGKTGTRYYRLKIIDNDGSIKYSAIRPVVFDDQVQWQVYPNPSTGIFNLSFQANDGEMIYVKIYDPGGKTVHQGQLQANGFVQKLSFDLRGSKYAAGLYFLEATAGEKKQSFRLIRQ